MSPIWRRANSKMLNEKAATDLTSNLDAASSQRKQ